MLSNILNPDYLIRPFSVGRVNNTAQICYPLREHDPLTKNKQINLYSNGEYKLTVFKSDFSNNPNQTSPLHIFNHMHRGLTKVPDYILFYETKTIVYALIIELKSHHFGGLLDKFNNGSKIAKFIHSFYEHSSNLQIINLLFRLPERAIKKPVYYKNYQAITVHDYGFACTLNHVYFDELVKAMHLQNL